MRKLSKLAAVAAVGTGITLAVTATVSIAGSKSRGLLASAIAINTKAETVTLPLFKGRTAAGAATWYIVTESSSQADAKRRGVTWTPKLANAAGTRAVQRGDLANGVLRFAGTVDFKPQRVFVASATGFPPTKVAPGAIGDARYSPLVSVGGAVLNAPQIKNASGQSDSVVGIDTSRHQVTLRLLRGFFNGTNVLYLRTDASIPLVAALEASTYAPNLNAAPGLASNGQRSARSAIIPIVNGARGKNNPERQGLQSAVLGQGDPLNITQSFPGSATYSPIWDVSPAVWAPKTTPKRFTSVAQIAQAVKNGELTSAGTGPANPSLGGLRALGAISNCAIVAVG